MYQSYTQMFTEQDILEENKYQLVRMGVKNDDPNFRVIIHKFNKDPQFNTAFKELLESLQNKLYLEENNEQIILVSKYLEGDNISLHLNFSTVTDVERLDYLYEYLHQAVAYIGFDTNMFNILISSSQITFIDHKLYLKEHIILDRRMNGDLPFTMIAKNIGQVMQRLLITNYHELRISKKYDDLSIFSESLIRREKNYQCFDELFNDFKEIYFTKSFRKKHVLVGNHHPNNMYLEQTQEEPFISKIEVEPEKEVELINEIIQEKETPVITEVTEAERAMLTGPIEESIDLSKLTDQVHSLDELLVKDSLADEFKETDEETTEEKAKDIDAPQYGVPNYFKEDKEETEELITNTKEPFKYWKQVITGVSIVVIAILLFSIMSYTFNKIKDMSTDVAVPMSPIALFEATIEGSTLICENQSTAYDGNIITESLWVLFKDGVEIVNQSEVNRANFRATDLTEGVYTIKLTVTDSKGQFSDPSTIQKEYLSSESKALENQNLSKARLSKTQKASDTTNGGELLDLFAISSTDNVSTDKSIYNTGTKSLKLNLAEDDATISFTDLDIPDASTISFWMMTDQAENIKVHVSGYNNGFNNYDKTLKTSYTDVLSWKVISVQLNIDEPTDNIILRFPKSGMIVWFDDLSIRTFK